MKLEISDITDNYIIRLVIFSLFLFKPDRFEPEIYSRNIKKWINKRTKFDINLVLDIGPKMSKKDSRQLLIDNIINDRELNYFNIVDISFNTGVRNIKMSIDLNDEEKWENYLYG
jgi:hypothetical protein